MAFLDKVFRSKGSEEYDPQVDLDSFRGAPEVRDPEPRGDIGCRAAANAQSASITPLPPGCPSPAGRRRWSSRRLRAERWSAARGRRRGRRRRPWAARGRRGSLAVAPLGQVPTGPSMEKSCEPPTDRRAALQWIVAGFVLCRRWRGWWILLPALPMLYVTDCASSWVCPRRAPAPPPPSSSVSCSRRRSAAYGTSALSACRQQGVAGSTTRAPPPAVTCCYSRQGFERAGGRLPHRAPPRAGREGRRAAPAQQQAADIGSRRVRPHHIA